MAYTRSAGSSASSVARRGNSSRKNVGRKFGFPILRRQLGGNNRVPGTRARRKAVRAAPILFPVCIYGLFSAASRYTRAISITSVAAVSKGGELNYVGGRNRAPAISIEERGRTLV